LFRNPSLLPCFAYSRIGSDADITSFLYGAGLSAEDVTHNSYGPGVGVNWMLGGSGVVLGCQAVYLPWGRWQDTIRGWSDVSGEYVTCENDGSPSGYRVETRVQYFIRPVQATLMASYQLVREHIEYVHPMTCIRSELDQTWQGMQLGAGYTF